LSDYWNQSTSTICKEYRMHTTERTDERAATPSSPFAADEAVTRRGWSLIRPLAFWAATLIIAYELVAGSVWNLLPTEFVAAQLHHLGYPHYLAYILGAWQAAAAVAIIAPRLPLIKEWAYVGCFFLWSGAVVSHWVLGDPVTTWWVPLTFGSCAVASWALRPADRRLPETRLSHLRRGRDAVDAPMNRTRNWETRPRAWVLPIAILVVLCAVSFLTLPAVEDMTHQWGVDNGWIEE
jgi:hypothetical protein